TGVFTNTVPTDAYRGAGRPEATYAIERAVDALARKLGKDPVEVRRLNFIREFPATIAAGLTIDSGDYDACLDRLLELVGYEIGEIEVLHGDTSVSPLGMDTYGSRSLAVGGVALYFAAEKIIAKAKTIAAHRLGVDEAMVDHVHGRFIGPDGSVTLKEIAL